MVKNETNLRREKLKNERINLILKCLMILLFISGAIVFSYPFVADAINNFHDQLVIDNYQKEMQAANQKQQKEKLAKMTAENNKLLANNQLTNIPGMGLVADPFDEAVKDTKSPTKSYFKSHTIGAIFIPAIHVSLPIFDETNDALLDKGATVLQGTSFPIGGLGTHSVITGHSGLPEKKLFTDLEKLKKGDLFYIEVSGEKLAYRIESFKTVLPTHLDDLKIDESKDLVTLLTCTPYMINTHRLLVTGVRVPYTEAKMEKQINQAKDYHFYRMLIFAIIIPLFFIVIIYWIWRKFVYYQSIKHNYDFVFYITKQDKPLSDVLFVLNDRKGQPIRNDDGTIKTAKSNQDGYVIFNELPGGKYFASPSDSSIQFPKVFGYIWFVKDKTFKLKSKKVKITKNGHGNQRKYIIDKR